MSKNDQQKHCSRHQEDIIVVLCGWQQLVVGHIKETGPHVAKCKGLAATVAMRKQSHPYESIHSEDDVAMQGKLLDFYRQRGPGLRERFPHCPGEPVLYVLPQLPITMCGRPAVAAAGGRRQLNFTPNFRDYHL